MPDSPITAVDYIHTQLALERRARELMPYDPDACTYIKGELRQQVYACLTCSRANGNVPIGVCYSCSIQCHSTHDLVELFTKRKFVCDCGTTKMAKTSNGACRLRLHDRTEQHKTHSVPRPRTGSGPSSRSHLLVEFPAEDIPSLGNLYNHNFEGRFCECKRVYNPLEETGNMHQCHFGFVCGEDWFHEDCILGYTPGLFGPKRAVKEEVTGQNLLEELGPAGEDAFTEHVKKRELVSGPQDDEDDDDEEVLIPHFPSLDDFDQFICWKCAAQFKAVFDLFPDDVVYSRIPHFENVASAEDWKAQFDDYTRKLASQLEDKLNETSAGNGKSENSDDDEPKIKRAKIDEYHDKKDKLEENGDKKAKIDDKVDRKAKAPEVHASLFLTKTFRNGLTNLLKSLEHTSAVHKFLTNHSYLYRDDPIFQPPPESNDHSSTTGSLLELGAEALKSLPKEQAVEGLEAYDKVREKLRAFFKPFAEQGKVVTEEEVRDFFKDIKKENNDS